MKKLFFLCAVFFGIGLTTTAQTFIEQIRFDADFVQHSIAQLGEDYIIAGTQEPGFSGAGTEIRVLRINNTGTVVWSKNFDFGGTDAFVGSIVIGNEDRSIALTGYVGTNGGPKDLLIARLDGNGNLLAELTISDPPAPTGFGYELYGMDIVQKENGDYIVVGTGSDLPISANFNKYGFVLSVTNGLTAVNWQRQYFPGVGPSAASFNNSMNHITKVSADISPNGQEMFLLNGTTTRATEQIPEGFMTLIDGNGIPLWSTNYTGRNGVYSGGMAVYSPSNESFYVSYPWIESQLETVQVDFTIGNIAGAYYVNSPGENLVSFLLNGLELDPSAQGETPEIIYTGFLFNSPFDTGKGRHFSFSIDYTEDEPSINWQRLYRPDFSISDYLNINFDFIAQPLNVGNTPVSILSNLYYSPKGLLIDNNENLVFTGLEQIGSSSSFSLDLYRTTLDGDLDCECTVDWNIETFVVNSSQGTNFTVFASPFSTTQPGLSLFDSGYEVNLTCTNTRYCDESVPQVQGRLGVENELENVIRLYPNPVKDQLYITAAENTKVRIYDIQSKLLVKKTLNKNLETINLSHLSQGIYFAKFISSSGEVLVKKVIKN